MSRSLILAQPAASVRKASATCARGIIVHQRWCWIRVLTMTLRWICGVLAALWLSYTTDFHFSKPTTSTSLSRSSTCTVEGSIEKTLSRPATTTRPTWTLIHRVAYLFHYQAQNHDRLSPSLKCNRQSWKRSSAARDDQEKMGFRVKY